MLALYPALQIAAPIVAQYGIKTAINYFGTQKADEAFKKNVDNTGNTLATLMGLGTNALIGYVIPGGGLGGKALQAAGGKAIEVVTNELFQKAVATPE